MTEEREEWPCQRSERILGKGWIANSSTHTFLRFSSIDRIVYCHQRPTAFVCIQVSADAFTPKSVVWLISYSGVTVDVSVMSLKYQSPSPLECWTPLLWIFVHSDVSQYVSQWNVEPSLHCSALVLLASTAEFAECQNKIGHWNCDEDMYVQKPMRSLYMHFTRVTVENILGSFIVVIVVMLENCIIQMLIVEECKECPVTVTSICSAGPPSVKIYLMQKQGFLQGGRIWWYAIVDSQFFWRTSFWY